MYLRKPDAAYVVPAKARKPWTFCRFRLQSKCWREDPPSIDAFVDMQVPAKDTQILLCMAIREWFTHTSST